MIEIEATESNEEMEEAEGQDDSSKEMEEEEQNLAHVSELLPKQLEALLKKVDNDEFTQVKMKKQKKQYRIPTDETQWADIRYGYMMKLQATDEPP